MRTKRLKTTGVTHAVVGTLRAIEHLDSTIETHRRDQEQAKKARALKKELVVVDASGRKETEEPLKFPSLNSGVLLSRTGDEITPDIHRELLKAMQSDRGYYRMTQTRADGRTYSRKRKTKALRQVAITFRPDYARTFSELESTGMSTRRTILRYAKEASQEFERDTGLEVVAVQMHPEEGNLHFHITYTAVNDKHELLHDSGGAGRKGLKMLGPASIATLRLVDLGFWPEEDAALAKFYLKDRNKSGREPIDWVLSGILDGLCEKTITDAAAKKAVVKETYARVLGEYSDEVKKRRYERPDLVEARLEHAQSENEKLKEELASSKAEAAKLRERLAEVEGADKGPTGWAAAGRGKNPPARPNVDRPNL